MPTWAERRDAYTTQRRAEAREDQRRNALNQIFASAYEPGETTTTPMYGPTQTGAALPPVVEQQPGGLNIQNALAGMYRGGFAPEAMQLEQEMRNAEMKRMQLGQRPSAVQVYEYYKSLPNDMAREEMLRTMRSAQYGDVGGVRSEMPVLPGAPARPLGTLSGEAGAQAAIEAAKARAGAQAKADVEIGTGERKKEIKSGSILEIADKANRLLDDAAGSYAGSAVSVGKQAIGFSDKKTKANSQLELLSGWLVSNVPRMEGPQSNFDVKNYKIMAARVGDSTVPVEDRRAALKMLVQLQNKYSGAAQKEQRKVGDVVQTKNGPMLIQRVNPDGTYEGIPAR
jgi:hypothetical protein